MPRPEHPRIRWRRRLSLPVLSLSLLSFACRHAPAPSPPSPALSLGLNLPMPGLAVTPPQLRRSSPDLRIDPTWLDLDGFFPPGAKRVGPAMRINLSLAAERRTRFPSTDLCPSPDHRLVLFHDGMQRGNDIYHWLMLLKHDAPFPNTIFLTTFVFDATWSEDSRRFAVTHFVGDNSSEVFTVDTLDLIRKPIDVRPFLEEHFPPHVLSAPMFLKAYRWTTGRKLDFSGEGFIDGEVLSKIHRRFVRRTNHPWNAVVCDEERRAPRLFTSLRRRSLFRVQKEFFNQAVKNFRRNPILNFHAEIEKRGGAGTPTRIMSVHL